MQVRETAEEQAVSGEARSLHQPMLPVIVDAMGGDHAPSAPVQGAIQAAAADGVPVILVGHEDALRPLVGVEAVGGLVHIHHAPDVVGMGDEAVAAVRRRPGSSIVVAMDLLRAGRGCAVVSAGHSGAVVAAAVLHLGRLPGIERPALGIPFPTTVGKWVLVIDAGAVVDPRPQWLVQQAALAAGYVRTVWGVEEPRIGLLSNGEEPEKGNRLVRETHHLLAQAFGAQFTGNVEPHQIPDGPVDVVVCDGFTGNILLKTAEGVAALIQRVLRDALRRHWYTALLGLMLRPTLRREMLRLDYRTYGGVPLLGVNGLVYVAHGRSDAYAMRRAVQAAAQAARAGLLARLERVAAEQSAVEAEATDR